MKGKRINPLERHVEKLFFLLIVLALLAVLVKQFATGGMTVKVGQRSGLTISQGYDSIASEAEQISGLIKANELDDRAPKEAPGVEKLLEALIDSRSPEPVATIVWGVPDSGGAAELASSDLENMREGVRYAMPDQPAPERPLVRLSAGALDPVVVAQIPELGSVVGPEQPFDMQFVTVSAQFDAEALRQAFSSDPDGSGPIQAIPRHWWLGMLTLLDVELWRQEVNDSGSTGAEVLVATMPGAVSLRDQCGDDAKMNMQMALEMADQAAEQITRPPFYSIIAGPVWNPPAPPVELTPEQEEALSKLAMLERIAQDIEDAKNEYNEAQSRGSQHSRLPGGSTTMDNAWVGGFGGGRGGRGNQKPKVKIKSAEERQREARERRLASIQDRIDRLEESRSEVSAWFIERDIDPATVRVEDPGAELLASPVGSLKDSDTLTVWAHDIRVEPGAEYRYRIRLVYGNPFYGRENVIHEDQREELSRHRVIRSGFSPWSDPVEIDSRSYLFLTRANGEEGRFGGGGGVAAAEMYSFYYGYWRQAEIRLRAGDPIAGVFGLPELSIYEVVSIPDGRPGQVQVAESPVPSSFEHTMGSVLLDIRRSARVFRDPLKGGREPGPFEAVVLGPTGLIEVRNPETDRRSDRRRRLMASAEEGATAVPVYPGSGGVAQAALEIRSKVPELSRDAARDQEDGPSDRDGRDGGFGR